MLSKEGVVTVESVKAEIEATKAELSKRLRHLRALLRCMEDEKKPESSDAAG
mgnify:CR=1 FL=1